jgi:two-component system LytT family response regulator
MKAFILDDEQKAIDNLKAMLLKYCPEFEVVNSVNRPTEFLKQLANEKYDVVFLDVELPEINGFDLIERVRAYGAKVILISSHLNYAVDGYDHNIEYFLPKPISKLKLLNATQHLLRESETSSTTLDQERLGVYDGKDYVFLVKKEIIRIKAEGNYSRIFSESGSSLLISQSIGSLEERLDQKEFLRCHRSHLVNKKSIVKYTKSHGGALVLLNGDIIPISRSAKKIVDSNLI